MHPRPDVPRPSCRAAAAAGAGFTLIELLIVIAILGILAAAFLPDLLAGNQMAKVTATDARMQRLATGAETYERRHGNYPPDDLQDPEGKLQFKSDNGLNTGIESLVAFLSQTRADGHDLGDMGRHLTNTDKDAHAEPLPLLGRRERLEVADDWDMPLAYFSKNSRAGGFAKPQSIAWGEAGDVQSAKARTGAEGTVLGFGKFQLLSAGPDGQFGTDDDISYPGK